MNALIVEATTGPTDAFPFGSPDPNYKRSFSRRDPVVFINHPTLTGRTGTVIGRKGNLISVRCTEKRSIYSGLIFDMPRKCLRHLDFYECGICGHLHPRDWDGDCRDDGNRFTYNDLEDTWGKETLDCFDEETPGWRLVPMPV